MENFQEDAKQLSDLIAQLTRMFTEARKLHFQNALHSADDPYVYICSNTFQDYLCTYVHSYSNVEVQFDEIQEVVNPDVYKNGVLIFSRDNRRCSARLDSESSDHPNNYNGPLNSTPNHTVFEDDITGNECGGTQLNIHDSSINLLHSTIVKCGSCEMNAGDVNMGGTNIFHGSLGQFRKTMVTLKDVSRVTSVNGRHLSSLYIHALKHWKHDVEPPASIVCCAPKSPMNISNLILFPRTSNGKRVLHIVSVFSGGEKKKLKVKDDRITTSTYNSTYDILTLDSDVGLYDQTSLKVEYHWSGNNFAAMQGPPPSAKPIIQLQVTVGDDRSATNEIYTELKRLQMNKSILSASSSSCSEQVLADVSTFKTHVEDIQFYNQDSSMSLNTDDIETPMSQLLMESFWNKDIDFTDKLWRFIQDPEHMHYIPYILDDVLGDIVNGSLQPAISPNNDTKLARYIRRMYITTDAETLRDIKEKITDLTSTDQSIHNLVQEIGYEKLRKDYFNFFVGRELTSVANLEKICKPSVVDIDSLWKLHYCLEIVITPTIYLNVTSDCQSVLLNSAIDYYCKHDVEVLSPVFHLLVLPFHKLSTSLHAVCKDRRPVAWQHGIVQTNKGNMEEAHVHRVTVKTVVGHSATDAIGITEEENVFMEETLVLPNIGR